MSNVKLLYFDGCPNSKDARTALLTAGVYNFDVVNQECLPDGDPLKGYSSPTILRDDEIIWGSKSDSPSCTSDKVDITAIHQRLKGRRTGLFSTIGSIGSGMLVGLCPVCIPAIGAFLTSIGLGFVVQEVVLEPLLIIMLIIANGGLLWSYLKEHRDPKPLIVGIAMGIAMYVGRYVYFNGTLNLIFMYGSIPGLIGAAIWNFRLRKKASCLKCTPNISQQEA